MSFYFRPIPQTKRVVAYKNENRNILKELMMKNDDEIYNFPLIKLYGVLESNNIIKKGAYLTRCIRKKWMVQMRCILYFVYFLYPLAVVCIVSEREHCRLH